MDPLTEEQIEALRAALVRLRDDLDRGSTTAEAAARPVGLDEPIGRVSRIDAIQQQQMARAAHQAMIVRRQQIEAALAAIERGEYGLCRRCEEPIAVARLQAAPETPFCLDCQSEIEQRNR
mgnify:FL=1